MQTKYFKQAVTDAFNGVESSDEVRGGVMLEGLDIALAIVDGLVALASAIEVMNTQKHYGDL